MSRSKGHMSQGQKSRWSRSNKDSKGRQLGSQRQLVSFKCCCDLASNAALVANHISESIGPMVTLYRESVWEPPLMASWSTLKVR